MTLEPFEAGHVDGCLALLEKHYRQERDIVSVLPPFADYAVELRRRLETMAKRGLGWVLAEGNRPMAMMGGYRVHEFFGGDDGVFVPVYAHLRDESLRGDELVALYASCADRWVKDGMTSHAVNIFAHDRAAMDRYVSLGFGLRCVDSIRETARLVAAPVSDRVQRVERADIERIAEVHRRHCLYYRQSPMFMPTPDEDPVQDLRDWMCDADHRILAYFEDGACLGYIRFQPSGESVFSAHPAAMSITGLFVVPEARNRSVGAALLDGVEAFLSERGLSLTGVDFESVNPAGARFWGRYFTPYSYSLTRRVDEDRKSVV